MPLPTIYLIDKVLYSAIACAKNGHNSALAIKVKEGIKTGII